MKETQKFTEGKIFLPLIQFALPVLFALFLQTMYGAIDLLIVGQFGGDLSGVYVSAVSTGSQVMQTLTVIITGLAMGLTVFVGREIGAGMREKAGKIIGSIFRGIGGSKMPLITVAIAARQHLLYFRELLVRLVSEFRFPGL
ncbi:MAG: MATE family efflux transporter [Lachnospiraceae bacterium]